jgi:hypothetical protein
MTRRAQDEVDLTYITPRTIAMSFPATGYEGDTECRKVPFGFFSFLSFPHNLSDARLLARSLAAAVAYRNDIDDVAALLRYACLRLSRT